MSTVMYSCLLCKADSEHLLKKEFRIIFLYIKFYPIKEIFSTSSLNHPFLLYCIFPALQEKHCFFADALL